MKLFLKKNWKCFIDKYDSWCEQSLDTIIALLVVCQILDGVLTYIGVSEFGTWREGNPLLKYLMDIYSPGIVLLLVKFVAIIMLYTIKLVYDSTVRSMLFIVPCLYIILFIYVFRAILPWIWVLLF